MAGLGLVLGTTFEPRNIGLMFGFIILPITFLGGTYYRGPGSPRSTSAVSTGSRRSCSINPLIYVNEGMRRRSPARRTCTSTSSIRCWSASRRFPAIGLRNFRRRVLS